MKKLLIISIALTLLGSMTLTSQTSKWGLSYAAEFPTIEVAGYGETYKEDVTMHNINLHYSVLSWASPFQIGPLLSYRMATMESGDNISDLQVGLNLGYNFSDKLAIVMDTYKVLDDIDNHGIVVVKPALEINISNQIAGQIGFHKYIYSGTYRADIGLDDMSAGGLLVGVKYKF